MPDQTSVLPHQHKINKADNINSGFNKVEQLFKQPEKKLPDVMGQPEKKKETISEKEKAEKEYNKVNVDYPEQSPYVVKSSKKSDDIVTTHKSKTLSDVEYILAEDLESFFTSLDANKQQEFKKLGEEIAIEVDQMVRSFKVVVRRVVDLIKKWLSLIPGINKYYLEQEAKIKTQRIIEYATEYKRKNKYKY